MKAINALTLPCFAVFWLCAGYDWIVGAILVGCLAINALCFEFSLLVLALHFVSDKPRKPLHGDEKLYDENWKGFENS